MQHRKEAEIVKFSTIVGVYLENHPNPSMLPNNPLCLCLEHQDTEIAASPFTFPINAIQACTCLSM